MAVSPEQIKQLCQLARLSLSQTEIARLEGDLGRILIFVDKLIPIDTALSKSTASNVPVQSLRSDKPAPPDEAASLSSALANAASVDDGYFLIPPVLRKGGAEELPASDELPSHRPPEGRE